MNRFIRNIKIWSAAHPKARVPVLLLVIFSIFIICTTIVFLLLPPPKSNSVNTIINSSSESSNISSSKVSSSSSNTSSNTVVSSSVNSMVSSMVSSNNASNSVVWQPKESDIINLITEIRSYASTIGLQLNINLNTTNSSWDTTINVGAVEYQAISREEAIVKLKLGCDNLIKNGKKEYNLIQSLLSKDQWVLYLVY